MRNINIYSSKPTKRKRKKLSTACKSSRFYVKSRLDKVKSRHIPNHLKLYNKFLNNNPKIVFIKRLSKWNKEQKIKKKYSKDSIPIKMYKHRQNAKE